MRILAATGGAPHSDAAVKIGSLIRQSTGGTITLLTVVKNEEEQTQANAILARARTLVQAPPGEVTTRVRVGQVAEEIIREAESQEYDLLVVGERIQHGFTRRLLAPVGVRVLAKMPCPVLIARGEPREIRRVLVCEGGRDPSLLTRLIAELSPLLKPVEELTVLHVMSQIAATPGVPGWELRAEAQELMEMHTPEGTVLESDLAELARLNVRTKAKVRHGPVVKEILGEVQDSDYDLVVIGSHQASGWERYLLDDLAHEIVHDAGRPILVI